MPNASFWQGKSVFVTGHTGFKGSWLTIFLAQMGARVHGYSLEPENHPSMFKSAKVEEFLFYSNVGDITDANSVFEAVGRAQPDVIIHLAAQPLVKRGYAEPLLTYNTNVMGTANVLEAVRKVSSVRAVLCVTTDKCYENRGWYWGYRETDRLGGHDPYSSSKACSELVAASYRSSFFPASDYVDHGVSIATARAGNVIGGGDWAPDRLIPDVVRAFIAKDKAIIRSPEAVRPWQHVLEPLSAYLDLCELLWSQGPLVGESWNFGPVQEDARPVRWVVDRMAALWNENASWELDDRPQPHEARSLYLDISKAANRLGYRPRWRLEKALEHTVSWYKKFASGEPMRETTLSQIDAFRREIDMWAPRETS